VPQHAIISSGNNWWLKAPTYMWGMFNLTDVSTNHQRHRGFY
jgi:hypothetical protein